MSRVFQYYSQFNGVRGNLLGLPAWTRPILIVAVLPGILLLILSAIVFVVSLLALFILTAPTYRLLRAMTGLRPAGGPASAADSPGAGTLPWGETPGARHQVRARVIEAEIVDPERPAQE